MSATIAEQLHFRPQLPEIYGCKDYREMRELIVRIDDILIQADTDLLFRKTCLEQYDVWVAGGGRDRKPSPGEWAPPYEPYTITGKVKQSWINHTRCAMRVNIARFLTNDSLRKMSIHLADSAIIRWFCHVNEFGPVTAQSKSTVDRYEDWIDADALRPLITGIIQRAAGIGGGTGGGVEPHPLGLKEQIELADAWLDGTCLKANIHFPVDWVLFRDIARTLLKATTLIRERGLKNRMPQSPEAFMRDMNKLVIEMTECRRKKDGKKMRKKVLRKMIALAERIARHARTHRDILVKRRGETGLSPAQADRITGRIDGVLEQLPAAVRQARERIIGERKVASQDKTLSIYEPEINVIVRGKADAEVEFGNVFRLAEQRQGLILDWEFYKDGVSDSSAPEFAAGVDRLVEVTCGKLENLWTDRGMESKKNVAKLEGAGIGNGICPKSPATLGEKMADEEFANGQRRRASTEGRVGIFKNNILGGVLRNKGYGSRRKAVAWGVMAHNLWVLARLPAKEKEEEKAERTGAGGARAA